MYLEACPDVDVLVDGPKVGLIPYTPLRGHHLLLGHPLVPHHAPTLQRLQHEGRHLRGLMEEG